MRTGAVEDGLRRPASILLLVIIFVRRNIDGLTGLQVFLKSHQETLFKSKFVKVRKFGLDDV